MNNPLDICKEENCDDDESKNASVRDMLSNLLASGKDVLTGIVSDGGLVAAEELSTSRLAICYECPFFSNQYSQCSKCGCYMSIKTKLAHVKCPVGKW